jgi:hypothetical protein
MKGKSRTANEKQFHDRVAALGCIACKIDGWQNNEVLIHHVDGRTKPGAHLKVLPLCAGHHQDGTGLPGLIAVHPWKSRFESKYGSQMDLIDIVTEAVL